MSEETLDRIKESYLDMLNQACGEWDSGSAMGKFLGYDSMCLSAYENALDLAIELGWIKPEERTR